MNLYIFIAGGGAALFFIIVLIVVLVTVLSKRKNKTTGSYYSQSLQKGTTLGQKLRSLFGKGTLDESLLLQLEETLIAADIGPRISYELIEKLKKKNITSGDEAILFLKKELASYLSSYSLLPEKGKLHIFLVIGVNGVGKTTSIAKLSHFYKNKGYTILLAAGDTFRAAASEQLTKWAHRIDVPVIKQQEGADPASVVFDAIDSARSKNVDILIVDTAGRLHNKNNLIEELKKINRIIEKKGADSVTHILVIDATTGQNAYQQAESFQKAVGVDTIIVTKYDADAKGGTIMTIEKNLQIPFSFIGTGEKIDDFQEFNAEDFINKIFS